MVLQYSLQKKQLLKYMFDLPQSRQTEYVVPELENEFSFQKFSLIHARANNRTASTFYHSDLFFLNRLKEVHNFNPVTKRKNVNWENQILSTIYRRILLIRK